MAAAITLSLLWPELGAPGGPIDFGLLTKAGIALVFFLHGAALSPAALKAGATHWQLHLLVQGTTFVLFPLLGGLIWFATPHLLPEGLRLGFFFLCAICSTISSSVAMTAMARGNVAAAIFNATLSGLIGMILTPLLMGIVSALGQGGPTIGAAILDIVKALLAPFLIGHLCRPLIGDLIARHKKIVSLLDRGVIVLIVFVSFAESTAAGLWSRFGIVTLALVALIALVLLGIALGCTTFFSRRLGLSRPDEAAAVFCGSKKSLANGAPIAKILFAGHPAIGMIVLPLLIYHQIQLIVCAMLARRYAAAVTSSEVRPESRAAG